MCRFLVLACLALVVVLVDAAPASAQVVTVNRVGVFPFRRTRVGFVGGGFAPVGVGFHQPAAVVGFAPRVGFAPVGVSYGFAPVGFAPVHATVGGFQGYGAFPVGVYGAPAYGAPACHSGGGGAVIQGSFGFGY